MSPGKSKKKSNSRWGHGKEREKFPEQQGEIPRITEILCTDFLIYRKGKKRKREKTGEKKKQGSRRKS